MDRQSIHRSKLPSHLMSFPQELVDEILSYLSSDDKQDQQSLRNCSLVAKSWINPSRRHLFKTILIRERDRQSWLDRISPSNIELLRHVRSFCFYGSDLWDRDPPSKFTDIEDLYVYFPSFRRLHTIDLCEAHISSDFPEQVEMFSPYQQVLSSLILAAVSLPWRSFVALIDYFPNLRNLELQSLSFEDDNVNTPPLSRPLRGKLCFYLSEEEYLVSFSNWFTGLEVEYEELVIDVGYVSGTYSQRIATTCGKTLKHLRFQLCECVAPWIILRTLADPTLELAPLRVSFIIQNFVNWSSPRYTQHIHTRLPSLPSPPQTSGRSRFCHIPRL